MSFLSQLKGAAGGSTPNEYSVMPAFRPGDEAPTNTVLPTLRLRQMFDLARAYGLEYNQNATRNGMLRVLQNAYDMGAFNGPPKNPYYFERAKFNSDEMKQARISGGYCVRKITGAVEQSIPVTPLFPWRGPDPEADRKKVEPEYEPGASFKKRMAHARESSIIHKLRQEAKELGINSFGKKAEALKVLIAEKKGVMAPVENPNIETA